MKALDHSSFILLLLQLSLFLSSALALRCAFCLFMYDNILVQKQQLIYVCILGHEMHHSCAVWTLLAHLINNLKRRKKGLCLNCYFTSCLPIDVSLRDVIFQARIELEIRSDWTNATIHPLIFTYYWSISFLFLSHLPSFLFICI